MFRGPCVFSGKRTCFQFRLEPDRGQRPGEPSASAAGLQRLQGGTSDAERVTLSLNTVLENFPTQKKARQHLRRYRDFSVCVLLNFFKISSFLTNKTAYKVIMG